MQDYVIGAIVTIGYILLMAYYWYVSSSISDTEKTIDGSNTFFLAVFLSCSLIIFVLFWGYKAVVYSRSTESYSLLGIDNLYFIFFMIVYLTVSLGIVTNVGFNWVIVAIILLCVILAIPFGFKEMVEYLSGNKYPATDSTFGAIIYKFYISSGFLFTALIIGLIVLFSNTKLVNIPNIGTWQIFATIATIIFGLKHMLFYWFSISNIFMLIAFIVVLSILAFLMVQSSGISQTTLIVFFTIACFIFAIMVPNTIPYLSLVFFVLSAAVSVWLGIFTQRLNSSTVGILIGIFAVYLSIHFSNKIHALGGSNIPSIEGGKSPQLTMALYFISWALITILYLVDFGSNSSHKLNANTIAVTVILSVVPLFIFGGLNFITDKGYLTLTEGSWIGILITFVGILLMGYYLLSAAYWSHINYSIVAIILMFMFGTFGLMAYNLKNVSSLVFFFFILLLPVIFISLFRSSSGGSTLNGGMIVGGVFVLAIWIAISILFWKSSSITFANLLNLDILNISIALLLVYLVFYYIYETFTSKLSMSQRFSQIILIIICSYLFLQLFKKSKISKNPIIAFFINVVEYIPCLYDGLVSQMMNIKIEGVNGEIKEDFTNHPMGAKIIAIIMVCVLLYYFYPTLRGWLIKTTHTPGVSLIGETPMTLNELHHIKTYEELTGDPLKVLNNYGISFSINISPAYGNDAPYKILNFCGNLVVSYNTAQNQLTIETSHDIGTNTDEQVTLYRYNQFPLQKWVKIEVNYVGGTFDVFVDGKMKTSTNVVASGNSENVFVGESGSLVIGKIKDFMYYETPLSLHQIKNIK